MLRAYSQLHRLGPASPDFSAFHDRIPKVLVCHIRLIIAWNQGSPEYGQLTS